MVYRYWNYTYTQHVQCECVSMVPGLQVLKSQHTNMAFGGLRVERSNACAHQWKINM